MFSAGRGRIFSTFLKDHSNSSIEGLEGLKLNTVKNLLGGMWPGLIKPGWWFRYDVSSEEGEGTQDLLPLFPEPCIGGKAKSNLVCI